jgi:hypothetical protein
MINEKMGHSQDAGLPRPWIAERPRFCAALTVTIAGPRRSNRPASEPRSATGGAAPKRGLSADAAGLALALQMLPRGTKGIGQRWQQIARHLSLVMATRIFNFLISTS